MGIQTQGFSTLSVTSKPLQPENVLSVFLLFHLLLGPCDLFLLAKPTNRMVGTTRPLVARAGKMEKISVATCTSSNGKPSSTVTWETKLKGEAEFQEIRNGNGTITVISRYRLLPSREAHRQQLVCVVNYQLDRFTDSMTLNVLCE